MNDDNNMGWMWRVGLTMTAYLTVLMYLPEATQAKSRKPYV
jgi:hypothetical protein